MNLYHAYSSNTVCLPVDRAALHLTNNTVRQVQWIENYRKCNRPLQNSASSCISTHTTSWAKVAASFVSALFLDSWPSKSATSASDMSTILATSAAAMFSCTKSHLNVESQQECWKTWCHALCRSQICGVGNPLTWALFWGPPDAGPPGLLSCYLPPSCFTAVLSTY